MPAPEFRLRLKTTSIRPLVGTLDVNVATAIRSLGREMMKRIKAKIVQETFSARAKKALARSLTVKTGEASIQIIAKHPIWRSVMGFRSHQMTWLTKARRPIPIVTESGDLIFRSATPRSMADGKWIHPGHPKMGFLEKARQEARAFMRDKLQREYLNQIRKAVNRR